MKEVIQHQVLTGGVRLDKYLAAENIATSRMEVLRWIEDDLVEVNGKLAKAAYVVKSGDHITVQKPELKSLALTPKKTAFEILFEDADLLVINKPAGLVVHPGAGNYDESLVHGLLFHCQDTLSGIGGVERPGIVHRLDKGTSGVMVIAKTDVAHRALSQQFQEHTVKKEYHALVLGRVQKEQQTLVHLMKRSEMNRKKFIVNAKKGKEAITHVTVLEKNLRVSLVSVVIETGRTHQIRVHLSFIGHPVMGDETYGGTKKLVSFDDDEKKYIRELGHPLLHAHKLTFMHPRTKKVLTYSVARPADFEAAIKKFMEK